MQWAFAQVKISNSCWIICVRATWSLFHFVNRLLLFSPVRESLMKYCASFLLPSPSLPWMCPRTRAREARRGEWGRSSKRSLWRTLCIGGRVSFIQYWRMLASLASWGKRRHRVTVTPRVMRQCQLFSLSSWVSPVETLYLEWYSIWLRKCMLYAAEVLILYCRTKREILPLSRAFISRLYVLSIRVRKFEFCLDHQFTRQFPDNIVCLVKHGKL